MWLQVADHGSSCLCTVILSTFLVAAAWRRPNNAEYLRTHAQRISFYIATKTATVALPPSRESWAKLKVGRRLAIVKYRIFPPARQRSLLIASLLSPRYARAHNNRSREYRNKRRGQDRRRPSCRICFSTSSAREATEGTFSRIPFPWLFPDVYVLVGVSLSSELIWQFSSRFGSQIFTQSGEKQVESQLSSLPNLATPFALQL